ncbi:MAG: DeoR/GlpR family DNA-binding transcription regulator [Chloroflexota bacterium]|nr:DeoR/GlpR family DNA-binding transcription regulator [Chloroflexota bacterium]
MVQRVLKGSDMTMAADASETRRTEFDAATAGDERAPLAVERRMRIIEIVNSRKTVTVPELVAVIKASPASVRRDLTWLDAQGLVTRTYGGAVARDHGPETLRQNSPPYDQRSHEYVEEKRAISRHAASLINDGQTLIIDAGSTSTFLIPLLAQKRDLIIITNSLDIQDALAPIIEANPTIKGVSTGGMLYPRSRAFIGMTAEQALEHYFVDTTFLCVRGISLEHGLTVPLLEEIPLKRQMIKSARQVVVLADHTKFGRTLAGLIAPLQAAHLIITDDQVSGDIVEQFAGAGARIIRAPHAS